MREGSQERFSAFVIARGPMLMRLAWFLTADPHDAEDLVQATFAKLFVAWRRAEATRDLDAYARRVLVNAATDGHRRRSRRPPEQLSDVPVDPADRTDIAGTVASADRLRQLLSVLPAKQRAVLALRFGEDLSEAETAAALGITVGTVKSHTSRALTRLREIHARETAGETGHAQLG